MLMRNNNDFFSQAPQLDMQRSHFPRNSTHKTTFNAGVLIPIYVDEILPGDTVDMDLGFVVRQSTPIHPVMDNANFDTFWFFVPNRLLWDDWEHFITGGLDAGEWDAPTVYSPPMIRPHLMDLNNNEAVVYRGFAPKSLADYMGIPVGQSGDFWPDPVDGVSALPFRAYAKIWNDWFRSSSIQKEIMIPTESGGLYSAFSGTIQRNGSIVPAKSFDSCVYGSALLRVNRYHDLFSSALLEPQRGEPVGVPLEGSIPVTTTLSNSWPVPSSGAPMLVLKQPVAYDNSGAIGSFLVTDSDGTNVVAEAASSPSPGSTRDGFWLYPANLIADTSGANSLQISINDLRHAIAVQHILEIDARAGSGRYIDLLLGHFGVSSPDGRLQRAEYLGGTSTPINMYQVLQTSATNDVSPQGNTAAFSLTSGVNDHITKSFTEHGILMCVACVRHVRSYQQGLEKMWNRPTRYDWYWPAMANISEQAILNKEIFLSGQPSDNEAFGYQEAWYDYRYKRSHVTGAMRSSYPQSLDVWHYADYYTEQPYLSADWLMEGSEEIDRTLAVSSAVEDQFIADFAFHSTWYRVLPVYSIPGMDRL